VANMFRVRDTELHHGAADVFDCLVLELGGEDVEVDRVAD
jgi:hypothetical protein